MVIHKGIKNEIVEDEELDKQAQTCTIQGTVSIGTFPKHRQSGEDDTVKMKD